FRFARRLQSVARPSIFSELSVNDRPTFGAATAKSAAFPVADDSGVMGDLWLTRHADLTFSDSDIRLVERVATQCAIALRQARLYRDGQSQLHELKRLNQLTDDFIHTVSHDLRKPLTNMKMAMQMLRVSLDSELSGREVASETEAEQGRIARYFKILDDECEREIGIINDLLDLQQMYERVGSTDSEV
ncbi:MAG: histidine kinase dimerization/phospho-acceptor domain-containing protein, partial [Cyanobacteria bacterium P01_E01_bin.48]